MKAASKKAKTDGDGAGPGGGGGGGGDDTMGKGTDDRTNPRMPEVLKLEKIKKITIASAQTRLLRQFEGHFFQKEFVISEIFGILTEEKARVVDIVEATKFKVHCL